MSKQLSVLRTTRDPEKRIAAIINYLEERAVNAGWPPRSVTKHKSGSTTFKCAGVTTLLNPKIQYYNSVLIYKPDVLAAELQSDGIEQLIEGHITLKHLQNMNVLDPKDAEVVSQRLSQGYEKPTSPISPDWSDTDQVKAQVKEYLEKEDEMRLVREKLFINKEAKEYQLKQAGLPGTQICIEDQLDLEVRPNNGKWELEISTSSDSGSVALDDSALAQLITTLQTVQKHLNAPIRLDDITNPAAEPGHNIETDLDLS